MGSQYERQFVNRLEENDVPALRIPASGSGGDKDLPDVLLTTGDCLVAAELKKTSSDYAYIEEEEIKAVRRFARRWRAIPAGVFRFTQDTNFYLVILYGDLNLTDGGSLSVKRDDRKQYPTALEFAQQTSDYYEY